MVGHGWRHFAALGWLVVVLSACGGSGEGSDAPPAGLPGSATIGPAGGTVRSDDGVEVRFPPDALAADVTVQIAKDSTGAPPRHPSARPASAVYTLTPHGGDFRAHATVSIPVESTPLDSAEQMVLLTAKPGDTQWTVLSGATYVNGVMTAPVMSFSYFQVVTLADIALPKLVVAAGSNPLTAGIAAWYNNVGGAGLAGRISSEYMVEPGALFGVDHGLAFYARMTYPAGPDRASLFPVPAPSACRPVSYAHDGAAWTFARNGTPIAPSISHGSVRVSAREIDWPRVEPADAGPRRSGGTFSRNGFGAVHYYGNDPLPRGPFLPAQSSDPWASPPPNNNPRDDTLTWMGSTFLGLEPLNGRWRVDVSVPTDCGLSIQAVPLAFNVNVPQWNPDLGSAPVFQASATTVHTSPGTTPAMYWRLQQPATSVQIEFAADPVAGTFQPVPASWRQERAAPSDVDPFQRMREYVVAVPNAQLANTGGYRIYACNGDICAFGPVIRLNVSTDRPRVVVNPQPKTVVVGEYALFEAAAAPGCDVFDVSTNCTTRWQKLSLADAFVGSRQWIDLPGFEGSQYGLITTNADSGMLYRAVFTNGNGSTFSEPALLLVVAQVEPPTITSQPASQSVLSGSSAVFVATVAGTPPFSYQWRKNGVNIVGANSATLTLDNVSLADVGSYQLVVSNRASTATSNAASLQVGTAGVAPVPPQITAAPSSLSVAEGSAASFAVSVSGPGPFTYAWLRGGTPIPGATAASFSIAATTASDAGSYSVRVANGNGSVESAAATLAVTPAPVTPTPSAPTVVTQPAAQVVLPGGSATFAVAVTGTAPLAFQWRRDGVNLAGATGPVLTIPAASSNDTGQYDVLVTNGVGATVSATAPLIVVGAPAITLQPVNATVADGATATFSVTASGPALLYQWTRDGVAIAGATAANYTTPVSTIANSGTSYAAIVYNGAGIAFSTPATLTVVPAATAFPASAVPLRGFHVDTGSELWITDGTDAGTTLVKDIWPGVGNGQPRDFTRVGNLVLFVANDGSTGQELWSTDGTDAGTVRLTDIYPGAEGSLPYGLIACSGRLFFGANDGSTPGFYTSDGTTAGTVRLATVTLGIYDPIGCLNGVVYFHGASAATGGELWRSDGTVAGTSLLADIVPGTGSSNPEGFIQFQGQLYFQAANTLWRTDGTGAGTVQVSAAPSTPRNFAINGGLLYFSGTTSEAGTEPWRTDGTAAGTVMLADLVPGTPSSFPYRFTVSGGVTFFAANMAANVPATLWRTDGTAAGTSALGNLRFVAAYGESILDIDGTLYFGASTGVNDYELWKTDGTVGGTVRVADLYPGSSGSFPGGFFRLGNLLHFNATAPDLGSELWRSDGTSAGTVLVKDLCTPGCSGNPLPR